MQRIIGAMTYGYRGPLPGGKFGKVVNSQTAFRDAAGFDFRSLGDFRDWMEEACHSLITEKKEVPKEVCDLLGIVSFSFQIVDLKRVLVVAPEYLGRFEKESSPDFIAAIKALPAASTYEDYYENNLILIAGLEPMALHYDYDYDVLFWVAELPQVASGATIDSPMALGDWDVFWDSSVRIAAIDCLSGQVPVCCVEAIK
jgi:hypothetical protein